MKPRSLGESGIQVSPFCLGTMMFGDRTDAAEAGRIVAHAREAGVNFIDTADVYAKGESERITGALIGKERAHWVLATKVANAMGEGPENQGLHRGHMTRAIDASLERLATDYIDIYYLHKDDVATPLLETLETMSGFIRAGKVRHFALSNFRAYRIAEVMRLCDLLSMPRPVCLQPYYNAMNRMPEVEVLPACAYYGLGVVPYSPLARGVLTGKYAPDVAPPEGSRVARADKRMLQTEFRRESMEHAQAIAAHAQRRGITSGEFATAWVLANEHVSSVLAGPRTLEQWTGYLGALDYKWTPEDEKLVDSLVQPGHPSTPGYSDPMYPFFGRTRAGNPRELSLTFDVVVIGAGAAGMMCAATAGQRGRRVALIDHYKELGEKIRISGGGRCNFTNLHATHRDFLSRNPDFCRSALARYTPRDFIALVERHGIAWHEKTLGQLFCDESAKQIIELLRKECDEAGVEWMRPCVVQGVAKGERGYRVDTERGPIDTASLVVASGGLTVPKIGATPFAYKVAEQFGLEVVPPKPALVPLAMPAAWLARYGELSGVSLEVEITCGGRKFREAMLFTHRGLSGPAVLQASSYWQLEDTRDPLHVNLLPGTDARAFLAENRRSPATLAALLVDRWPARFAQAWCDEQEATLPITQLSERKVGELTTALADWRLQPDGTLGYNKAEVTLGGVDTRGLSSKTMEAREVPGLFFIGEGVDVTGHLGGFNFQWAWASGRAAGEAA